jgi:hypothetical protein
MENIKHKLVNSKKYNYEAMQSYNFDTVNFDFNFGDVDEKKHKEVLKRADEVDREDAEKKAQLKATKK